MILFRSFARLPVKVDDWSWFLSKNDDFDASLILSSGHSIPIEEAANFQGQPAVQFSKFYQ